MGKRFDTKAVMGYCDTMSDAYTAYGQAADHVQYACTAFADNNTFTGHQAEVTKELVGTVEVGLMDEILAVNGRIKGAQNNIIEMFASDVDAAPNARIDEDVLTGINENLKGYADAFDAIGKQVESIYSRLLMFSKYGSFTKPDFSSGRAAASALCGGSGNVGFVHECIQKLRDYDTDATAMLDGMGLRDAMSDIASRISRSSSSMRSYQIYELSGKRYNVNSMPTLQYRTDVIASHNASGIGNVNTSEADCKIQGTMVTRVSHQDSNDPGGVFEDLYNDGSINGGFCGAYVASPLERLKEWHYGRAKINEDLTLDEINEYIQREEWRQMPEKEAIYHTDANAEEPNRKYTPKDPLDGREIVLRPDGSIETDPRLMGTPNYCPITKPDVTPPKESYGPEYESLFPDLAQGNSQNDCTSELAGHYSGYVGHFVLDVLPYWAFGNTPDDDSDLLQRVVGFQAAHDLRNLSGNTFEATNGADVNDFSPGR